METSERAMSDGTHTALLCPGLIQFSYLASETVLHIIRGETLATVGSQGRVLPVKPGDASACLS